MSYSRDRAEPHHHLLVDVENGDQEHERPQQRGAVVLSRLGVGAERAGIIVADHHDQARADDGHQGLEPRAKRGPRPKVVLGDAAERTVDVSKVCLVQHGGLSRRFAGTIAEFCRTEVVDHRHD